MTDWERAEEYAAIFVGLGDRWEECVPLDGKRTKRGVRLGSVEIGPDVDRPGVFWVSDGETTKHYRKKAVKS